MRLLKPLFTFILPIVVLVATACDKEDDPPAEPTRMSIAVNSTDPGYSSSDNPHVTFYNASNKLNKLLLFIGGSYSNPKNYETICEHARTQGFHVISLSYPNNITAASLGDSEDFDAFENYREEICYGNPVSDDVEVNELNCIATRLTKLLQYLDANYTQQNWGQFLMDGNAPNWSQIVAAGHSQGAGHACYFGKTQLLNRVVMFAGPNDYSDFFEAPANWLTTAPLTPNTSQFVLLHGEDNVVPYEKQLENIRATGLLGPSESTTLMDDLSAPYANENAFHTLISMGSNHSAPIGENWRLPNFWNYVFGVD